MNLLKEWTPCPVKNSEVLFIKRVQTEEEAVEQYIPVPTSLGPVHQEGAN